MFRAVLTTLHFWINVPYVHSEKGEHKKNKKLNKKFNKKKKQNCFLYNFVKCLVIFVDFFFYFVSIKSSSSVFLSFFSSCLVPAVVPGAFKLPKMFCKSLSWIFWSCIVGSSLVSVSVA